MEFLDEDARPRFVLQSKASPQSNLPDSQTQPLHKPTLIISLSLSTIFLLLSFLYFTSEPLNSLFIWVSLSLLVGPFAPLSLTAGDIRVGLGPPLEQPSKEIEQQSDDNSSKRVSKKSFKFTRKPDDPIIGSDSVSGISSIKTNGSSIQLDNKDEVAEDWIEGEDDLLKKLMGKHPVGKPGRWEAIAEGLKRRHSVENVIKRAKEMGEKKLNDDDSYNKFLKDRKPVDKRIIEEEGGGWSSGEDLALLNALKAFPKETAMRWEKIAAAVPGKSKAACLKRMNELKKDFRTSKASSES
ncbi:hypothetical protein M9H77_33036 [Catharanthus roseus]|uniref:Uncharacterized protein n=1 Tax=Catharanthus roseus TaxID=4058 RepID=A0ACC0A5G0_CATRO|nr:hypothetical protein M9H77_33036 [Catharanthus roseus]